MEVVNNMGLTVEIDSLDEMCDLMCDNRIPEKKEKPKERWWVFTFGKGQEHEGYYVKIWGTYSSARSKMMKRYGLAWSFQYSFEDWIDWVAQAPAFTPIEKELEVIE